MSTVSDDECPDCSARPEPSLQELTRKWWILTLVMGGIAFGDFVGTTLAVGSMTVLMVSTIIYERYIDGGRDA